jgi:hypothetical protein
MLGKFDRYSHTTSLVYPLANENRLHRNSELYYGTGFAPFRKTCTRRSRSHAAILIDVRWMVVFHPDARSVAPKNRVSIKNNVSQTKLVTSGSY